MNLSILDGIAAMAPASLPENWQDLMAGYVLGNLSPEEEHEFQQLLEAQPELVDEVLALQEVVGLFPKALAEPEPPTRLYTNLICQLESESEPSHREPLASTSPLSSSAPVGVATREHRHSRENRVNRRVWWGVGSGAIAAVLLLALGVQNIDLRQQVEAGRLARAELQQQLQSMQSEMTQLRQDSQQRQTILAALQSSDLRMYQLEGTGEAATASARLIVIPGRQQVMLVGQQFPTLPAGQVYRLWAMSSNTATPRYCGEFGSTPNGEVVSQWSTPATVCHTTDVQMLVTRDRATDPLLPTGKLVLRSRA